MKSGAVELQATAAHAYALCAQSKRFFWHVKARNALLITPFFQLQSQFARLGLRRQCTITTGCTVCTVILDVHFVFWHSACPQMPCYAGCCFLLQ
jgi:hypothetical protein